MHFSIFQCEKIVKLLNICLQTSLHNGHLLSLEMLEDFSQVLKLKINHAGL